MTPAEKFLAEVRADLAAGRNLIPAGTVERLVRMVERKDAALAAVLPRVTCLCPLADRGHTKHCLGGKVRDALDYDGR